MWGHRVSVSASQYVRVDVPQSHSAPRALFRAASAGPWVPGHVVRPAGGSVRYSLGARPTSRACLVRQNQQRHGRPPHGAPLPRPGPATTPGRSMPVLIGHTARPVRRIFPSWQLLPAQLVVWYLRVNTRDKTKSGSCCAVVSCNCVPGGFVCRRRGRRRRSCGPKRRHLLPLLFLGCLGCLGCPLASSATTPLAFRRRLDVVSTGFSAGCPYRHRALAITATAVRAKRDADLLVASRFAMHTTGRWRGKGGRASGYKRAVLFGL